jgi:phosphoglycolate phosphatase
MMKRTHDLVLFDLDGTISDPVVGIGRSLNFALTHFGHAPLQMADVPLYVGPPLDESFTAITGVTSASDVGAMVAKYRERYGEVGYSENVLYPGIPEALAQLDDANVPLGLCTSKRADFAERILTMFGLRAHFRFVSGGDVGVQKWQQMAELRARNRVSEATVMVGDRAVDMIAAHRNGLRAAGVLWGHGSRSELVAEQPHYLFDSPAELATLVLSS